MNKSRTFFHSNLIVGATDENRRQKALNLAKEQMGEGTKILFGVDLIELGATEGKNVIGIEEIRQIQTKLSLRPYQAKVKVAIIYEMQKAGIEAQNCLLKTLEEPPKHSVIILTAPEKDRLLPTIVSRCRLIDLCSGTNPGSLKPLASLSTILTMTKGERLNFVEKNKTSLVEKEKVVDLIDAWLVEAHEKILQNPVYLLASKEALSIKKTISTVNVNLRLALETLLICLPVIPVAKERSHLTTG